MNIAGRVVSLAFARNKLLVTNNFNDPRQITNFILNNVDFDSPLFDFNINSLNIDPDILKYNVVQLHALTITSSCDDMKLFCQDVIDKHGSQTLEHIINIPIYYPKYNSYIYPIQSASIWTQNVGFVKLLYYYGAIIKKDFLSIYNLPYFVHLFDDIDDFDINSELSPYIMLRDIDEFENNIKIIHKFTNNK